MRRPRRRRSPPLGRLLPGSALLGLLLLALALQACAGLPEAPTSPELLQRSDRDPVVLVAGLTGVGLRHRDNGKVLWGRGWNLYFPRDGGTSLALPLEGPEPEAEGGPLSHLAPSPLEPSRVIRKVSLLGVTKPIYSPLFQLLEANGWVTGDLERPRPGDSFFPFAYDWRQDKIANAALLARRLEELRVIRGEETLSVTLICQSCGAHLCRWLAKYGGAGLEEAEAGAVPDPRVRVAKIILVGSSNGGSLRILREMDRGRTYLPLGRRWLPEVLFTFRSLYQDLPAYRSDLFVDREGRTLKVDLYDARSWQRHGWSVFSPAVEKRLERRLRRSAESVAGEAGRPAFGTVGERLAFLQRQLDRARRFQRLLEADAPGFRDTRYYSIQGRRTPTPDRAVLIEGEDGWELFFTGDRKLERLGLASRVSAPGDEHATVSSQMWLSAQETRALAPATVYAEGGHFELVLTAEAQQGLVQMLED